MTTEELKTFLYSLLSNWEDEVVEFKRGGKGFSTGEIGIENCIENCIDVEDRQDSGADGQNRPDDSA